MKTGIKRIKQGSHTDHFYTTFLTSIWSLFDPYHQTITLAPLKIPLKNYTV